MAFSKTRYVIKTLIHKFWVFRYGLVTRAPLWRLVIHDWTKFTPAELPAYAQKFYGVEADHLAFARAWNHHQKHNDHHWEAHVLQSAHSLSPIKAGSPLPMPEGAVREMVADWLGAERSYGGTMPLSLADFHWYAKERPNMVLHEETARMVEKVLSEYFASIAVS